MHGPLDIKYRNERYFPAKQKSVRKESNVVEIDLLESQQAACSGFRTEDSLHRSKDLLVSVCHLIRDSSRMSFAEMKGNAISLFMFSQTSVGP